MSLAPHTSERMAVEPPRALEDSDATGVRETERRFLRRGTWLNLTALLAKNISPLLVVLMARVLSRDVFGLFVSAQMMVLTLSRLTVLGADSALVWSVAQNERHGRSPEHGIASALQLSMLCGSALAVALGLWFALGDGLRHVESTGLATLAFALPCLASVVVYMPLHCYAAALEGAGRPEYKIYVNYSLVTTLTPLLALLLHGLLGLTGLAWGLLAANLTGALVLAHAARKTFPHLAVWRHERPRAAFLRVAVPLGLSEAVSGMVRRMDLWLVLSLLGPGEAGAYAVMLVLSNGLRSVREGYHPLLIRVVSRMDERAHAERLRATFSYAVNVVTAIQLVVATAVLFVPDLILSVAGKQYVVDPQALCILLVGNLSNGLFGLSDQVVIAHGRGRPVLLANLAALALNVGLNVFFIPRYGLAGAASASVLAGLAYSASMYAVQYRITGQHLYSRHLSINALLVLLFALAAFFAERALVTLTLTTRLAYCALALALLGAVLFLKRKTFSL